MNLLDKILEVINENLYGNFLDENAFQNADIQGLAYLSVPRDDSPRKPYIIDGHNVKDISINDSFDFSIYHRCTDIQFKDVTANTFGDGNGMIGMTCQMTAIVYADRFACGYSQEDMVMKVSSALNYTLTKADLGTSGLARVKSTVTKANNNSTAVFFQEYGDGANCPLSLESIYFAIQYTIDITATAGCLKCTEC
jgi:hypothetical protein